MKILRVYVAGPYTNDPEKCTAAAVDAGNALLDLGHAPFVPHLSHYWHTRHSARHYEDWMRIDLAWLAAADVVLRLPGDSPGADREVAEAERLGIRVAHSLDEVTAWPVTMRLEDLTELLLAAGYGDQAEVAS